MPLHPWAESAAAAVQHCRRAQQQEHVGLSLACNAACLGVLLAVDCWLPAAGLRSAPARAGIAALLPCVEACLCCTRWIHAVRGTQGGEAIGMLGSALPPERRPCQDLLSCSQPCRELPGCSQPGPAPVHTAGGVPFEDRTGERALVSTISHASQHLLAPWRGLLLACCSDRCPHCYC